MEKTAMREPDFDAGHWYLPNDDLLGYIHVPAGKFLMGSDDLSEDENPEHTVYLPDFWMARYPVTVAQFRVYCQQSGVTQGCDSQALRAPDSHPVATVNWGQALRYCGWLDARLKEFSIMDCGI